MKKKKNYSNLFENSSNFENNMGKIFLEHPVESLFAKNPIKETNDFICDEIYNHKTLKPICKLLFLRN